MTDASPTRARGTGSPTATVSPAPPTDAALARTDWSEAPYPGLGRAMARRDLDLATALCVFFLGAPERFNYLPKPDVPDGYRPVARHLDNICLRINSGFYLPAPGGRLHCRGPLDRWLACQRADLSDGHCGRWVLEEAVLAPLFDTAGCAPPPPRPEPGIDGLWRAVLTPLRAAWGPRVLGRLRK